VLNLQVHLPGQHMVNYNPNESIEDILARAALEKTMLTAFFQLNKDDPSAVSYSYQEIPLHYVWDKSSKQWRPRQRGYTIGRINFVSPTAGERFYLRTLLTTVKGPTSWSHLRTFDGVEYSTFHATCLARGLLENDDEWRQCLEEACVTHLGQSLRNLFCLILMHCQPSRPNVLWNDFKTQLCEDLPRRLQHIIGNDADPAAEQIFDYGLFLIDEELRAHGLSLDNFPSMPRNQQPWNNPFQNPWLNEQLNYHPDNELHLFEQNARSFNTDQRLAFDHIYTSVCNDEGNTFFLHGPGGTGKTFVYETLCHRIRANSWIVLCVASSGIASLLLPGGHTAHSTFSIPVESLNEDSSCQIDKNSKHADMLRSVRLIIWDEAVTQHRSVILLTVLCDFKCFL
jgi:hypothetical protein